MTTFFKSRLRFCKTLILIQLLLTYAYVDIKHVQNLGRVHVSKDFKGAFLQVSLMIASTAQGKTQHILHIANMVNATL